MPHEKSASGLITHFAPLLLTDLVLFVIAWNKRKCHKMERCPHRSLFLRIGLLGMLVFLAGCAQKPSDPAPASIGNTVALTLPKHGAFETQAPFTPAGS